MPYIIPSSSLRNNYNEISNFCRANHEVAFVTKSGTGDLAVMSIETYEQLLGGTELKRLLADGARAAENNRVRPAEEAFDDIENKANKRCV